jgi:hypothetical protein
MESKIVQDLISFYQAYNHSEVIKLIEQNVNLKKFKILKDKYYHVYIPEKLNKPVPMLCCHSDTVFPHIPNSFRINKGRLSCKNKGIGLGADDRNGCYLLHQMMLKRPQDFIFALFDLEELGCLGSRSFNLFPIQELVSIFIGLDRKGSNEFALYGYENEELLSILDTFPNYHIDYGSITDVAILADVTNICCFNLSVGYYKQHSEREFTIVRDVERAEKFLLNLPEEFWGKQYFVDYIFHDEPMPDFDRYYDSYPDIFKTSLFKKGESHE